jgi:L-ascorbate metabolism protein UlaG (beta-lactamase superfamily)
MKSIRGFPTPRFLLAGCIASLATLVACAGLGTSDDETKAGRSQRFQNEEALPVPAANFRESVGFYWAWFQRYRQTPRGSPAWQLPAAEVRQQVRKLDSGEGYVWLGHAAVLLNFQGKKILFDPFLSEYYGPVRLPGLRRKSPVPLQVEDLPALDAVLISHDHYDHLDRTTIVKLLQRQPDLAFVVPKGVGALLRDWGATQVQELGWHQQAGLAGLQAIAVPALHESGRALGDRDQRLWAGWVLRDGSRQVYFSGDTAYGRIFEDMRKRYGAFDLAFIGIGAYGPEHLLQRYHLTPEQAWEASRSLCAARTIPIHWGVMTNSTEPIDEPIRRYAAAAGVSASTLPRIGEFVPWQPATLQCTPHPLSTTEGK